MSKRGVISPAVRQRRQLLRKTKRELAEQVIALQAGVTRLQRLAASVGRRVAALPEAPAAPAQRDLCPPGLRDLWPLDERN